MEINYVNDNDYIEIEYFMEWFKFLKKTYNFNKSISLGIYKLILRPLKIHKETPSVKLESMWKQPLISNLEYFVINTENVGYKAYTKILYAFDLDFITTTTTGLLIKAYSGAKGGGSTIHPVDKFCEYLIDSYKNYCIEYGKEQKDVNKIDFIREIVKNKLFILMDNDLNVLNRNVCSVNDIKYIANMNSYKIEKSVFNYLKNISKNKYEIDDKAIDSIIKNLPYIPNEKQMWFLKSFKNYGVNVLTGFGGCGKSFTIKVVLDILDRFKYKYLLLTPTGIASQVLTNYTHRKASTIHMWGAINSNPLNSNFDGYDVIILDESSMLGLDHWKIIMNCMQNTNVPPKIIMLGDTGQLQPISEGNFFRDILDLIRNKVIYGNVITLDKVMRAREESFIAYCSSYFAQNKEPIKSSLYENKEKNVYMLPLDEGLNDSDNLTDFLIYYVENMGWDWKDTIVIIPQKVGSKGTDIVNTLLDNKLHKKYKNFKSIYMITKNLYRGKDIRRNGERFIKNKENIKRNSITIEGMLLENNQTFVLTNEEIDNITLSYANTVHKLQGSTVKNVIFLCSKSHTFMLTKQLVYTGLSRASESLTILYDKHTFERARYKDTIYDRKTFLGETIKKLKQGKDKR